MKKLSLTTLIFLFQFTAIGVRGTETVQRDPTIGELQSALGLFVTTTELHLDAPKYARFALIKETLGGKETEILRDMYFPATYFQFLNITDARKVRSGDLERAVNSIRMTCWNGETRKQPQGWSHTFDDIRSLLEHSSDHSSYLNYLSTKEKWETSKDIVVWEQFVLRNNAKVTQKLIVRFSDERWINDNQSAQDNP